MKKCIKCGFENPDSVSLCEKCFSMLGEKSNITSEDFFKEYDRKERIKELINYGILGIYGVVVLVFVILGRIAFIDTFLTVFTLVIAFICGLVFYLSIFHPDALFKMSNFHMIDNIDDVQPSDWYYTTTTWSAYLILAIGLFYTIIIYFDVAV